MGVLLLFCWVLVIFFGVSYCKKRKENTKTQKSRKDGFYIGLILYLLMYSPYWWRTNISINNQSTHIGCYVSQSGSAIRLLVDGEVVRYLLGDIDLTLLPIIREAKLNDCYIVKYYSILGDIYLHHIKKIDISKERGLYGSNR